MSVPQRTRVRRLALVGVVLCSLVGSQPVPASRQLVGGHVLHALTDDASDVNIFVAGDSTGDEPDEWVFLLAQQLGTLYPDYDVNYYVWNRRNPGWPSTPWVIQLGAAGNHVLNIWNMSVSGARENYGLTYAESEIVPRRPDLLLVSYGHNDGADTVHFRWGVQSLVETVAAQSPRTEILLMTQNPETGNNYQHAHAAELAELASEEHVGLVDVYSAFEATGNPSAYVLPDGIHPTFAGSWLWMNTVLTALRSAAEAPDGAQQGSRARPVSLIRFGDFSRFVEGKPAVWTLKNVKATVDFKNAEAPHRFAVRFTETKETGSYIYQPFPIEQVRGRWVTVAVRLMVPSSKSATVGMVGVLDSRTDASMTTQRGDGPRDRYFWDIVSRRIDPRAKSTGVILYVDANLAQSAGTVGAIVVQQVLAVLGTHAPLDFDATWGLEPA